MYVKSMVIDGFKSYGQRTEINGFDPLFNAVTGLNGSGKSNILDSICFVLGISNLSQVRATNLQDLVYKNGQAGITKATVSIVFDNSDKNQSPIGYEQYNEITVTRQVVVGGRNKYLINGLNAQNSRVQDLFRSVQLNVNNPHFLIMQGRITKVLNMKPVEILSMIEEAAGTKLYESKKQNAQKTVEKKDAKLNEINTILDQEITPTLTKLKDERASYLEYQKIHRELEHLMKIYKAYEFVCTQKERKEAEEKLVSADKEIKTLENRIMDAENEIKEIEKTISVLQRKRNEEEGAKLFEYEQRLKTVQSSEVKANSNLKNNGENIRAEQKKKKDLQKNLDEDSMAIKNKQQELEKLKSSMLSIEENEQKDAENLALAQKRFQAVSAGLSSNADGEEATLADQLIAAKTEIATADTEMKQAQMKVKHVTDELKRKKSELKKTESSYKKDQENYQKAEEVLKKVESEMKKLNYQDGQEEELARQRRKLFNEISEVKDELDSLQAKFPHLNFDYKNPEKNFDRSKVSGLLCNLFQVKDMQTARALEVVAGGKLYNIVVDSEITAKKLLQKGELKRRCTFVPLNKISRGVIPNEIVKKAEHLVGKENVAPALSLINCSNEVRPAMEFVFGNVFVCPDMNTAKKVAFDSGIQRRTVTLEGEVFDPSGTLSGGARSQGSSILVHANNMVQLQQKLEVKQKEMQHVDGLLANIQKVSEKFRQLKQQYDLKFHECELLRQKLQQSQHHLQLEEIQSFENTIAEQENVVKCCQQTQKKAEQKVKDLELKIKEGKSLRERELKAAEEEVAKCKKQAESSNRLLKEKQTEADGIKLEIDDLEKAVANFNSQIVTVDETIQSLQEIAAKLKETLANTKQEVAEVQAKLQEQKDLLKAKDKEINDNVNKQQELLTEINSGKLNIRQLTHDTGKLKSTIKEANQTLEHMVKKHEWIAEDKKYFGKPNTAYDFNANDPVEAGRRIQKLQETKDKMAKNVNMRAMNMLGKAEEQYNDLMQKKKIVENDKAKIAAVIKELDEKKNEALTKAWEQVNKDFGSIFSSLLPGTQAKLVPPEGQSVLDGLEVKVAFGNVWKESLGELSGGQRSLVALSLILSMLLFKPAPIYILDEVDAALDLSHTQNIGQMLHSHFKHSQFIVVSLKDGMFNNANVLFKTKFVEGMSTVSRFEQRTSGRR